MHRLKSAVKTRLLRNASWQNRLLVSKYYRLLTNRSFLMNHLRYGFVGDSIGLEASTKCQLKCPICPTATGENKNRPLGWGNLSFANFKAFVDRHPGIKLIELSNWGEIFLNPELKDIVRYGHEKGITLTAANGVNLNTANDEILEALVRYRFRFLLVSLDGASNETYQEYRKGGHFDRVIRHVERINHYKQAYKSEYPEMVWQYIIFGHNEHEIARAKEMAARLDMTFAPRLNAYEEFSPVRDPETVKRETGLDAVSRFEFREKTKQYYAMPCDQLWFKPQVNWDGKLLGCCVNGWADFGNVFEDGFAELLKGEKYSYAKQMLLGKKGPREGIACTTCPYYRRDEAFLFRSRVSSDSG
jgi:MoaA/NifB/PqqE/SkfB family radical SAM enzyme